MSRAREHLRGIAWRGRAGWLHPPAEVDWEDCGLSERAGEQHQHRTQAAPMQAAGDEDGEGREKEGIGGAAWDAAPIELVWIVDAVRVAGAGAVRACGGRRCRHRHRHHSSCGDSGRCH